MNWKTQIGLIGASLLVLMTLGFIIKTQYDTIDRLKAIETSVVESKNIGNGIIRAQSTYVTKKELKSLIDEQGIELSKIKKDLNVLGGDIKALHIVTISTPGYSGTNIPSTEIIPIENPDTNIGIPDKYGYFSSVQWLSLTEPFGNDKKVPFGKVGFSASQEKPWSLEILPREYQSTTILGQNEEGRHYAYTRFQVKVNGDNYTVPISESKIVEEFPAPKFHFTPRIYLGVDIGAVANPPAHAEITPNVGLSFFSWGKTKISPDWSFITLGIGYATQTQTPVLLLSPINYNVGKPLPFMDNLHIGPSASLDTDGNIGLYIGGRVGF